VIRRKSNRRKTEPHCILHLRMHNWFVDICSILSLFTSLCNNRDSFMITLKGPNPVEDKNYGHLGLSTGCSMIVGFNF
jgi:hypothetical protein